MGRAWSRKRRLPGCRKGILNVQCRLPVSADPDRFSDGWRKGKKGRGFGMFGAAFPWLVCLSGLFNGIVSDFYQMCVQVPVVASRKQ